jgi:hypothetical protein
MAPAGAVAVSAGVSPRVAADDTVLGTFEALGNGVNDSVRALAVSGDDTLYAGGDFINAGGNPNADRIAAWSNADDTWHALGAGLDNAWTDAVAVSGDDTVYAGGNFINAGGNPNADRIAAWSNADDTWHALGSGISGDRVYAVAVSGDDTVYAGGKFSDDTSASGVPGTSRIAAWSNADDTWHPLGTGVNSEVHALAVQGDDTVYAGGYFTNAGGNPNADKIAAWSNADDTWHALGTGLNGDVYAVAVDDDSIYAVGSFGNAGGNPNADKIALWSNADDTWHALGTGISAFYVNAVAVDDTRGLVYAGGDLTAAGGTTASKVVVWDVGLGEWMALQAAAGEGADSDVYALALDDSVLYLGGDFTTAGGVAVNKIARWTWAAPSVSAVPASGAAGTTISLEGSRLIGVSSVRVDGTPVSTYTRDDSTTISLTLPGALSAGSHTITVDAVGGRATTTYVVPSSPSPVVYPPGPPTAVMAVAEDGSATVSWSAPADAGSYPITDYQVMSAPSGGSCLVKAPAATCDVMGLANGTTYTFTARALNGAGWGASSGASNAVTPTASAVKSIQVTGSRDSADSRYVRAAGVTSGLVGEQVTPWIRFPGQAAFSAGSGVRTVAADGTFEWSRRTGKKVYVYFTHGPVRSNTVTIAAR